MIGMDHKESFWVASNDQIWSTTLNKYMHFSKIDPFMNCAHFFEYVLFHQNVYCLKSDLYNIQNQIFIRKMSLNIFYFHIKSCKEYINLRQKDIFATLFQKNKIFKV